MRNIILKRGSVAKYDDGSPFLVEAGELELCFTLPDPNGDYFAVDGTRKLPIPSDGRISLPVSEGTLRLSVKRYLHGTLIESYSVEPLEVKSVDGGTQAFPELSCLQRQVAALELALKEHKKQAQEREKQQTAAFEAALNKGEEAMKEGDKKLAFALFSFAWTDYRRNIHLNFRDLTLGEFLAVFGLREEDFTAEELADMDKEDRL